MTVTFPCRIELPWPPKELSPNQRVHRMVLAKRKREYRTDCAWLAKAAGLSALGAQRLAISITFRAPDRRGRDLDNMLASMKAGLDGLADIMGVDDSRWALSISRGEPVKAGAVIVEVTPA